MILFKLFYDKSCKVFNLWLIQPRLLGVSFPGCLSNVLCINKFFSLWLEGNKVIPGGVGYENFSSYNTMVIVFSLEHVLVQSHGFVFFFLLLPKAPQYLVVYSSCKSHGVLPAHMQTYIQPKTQGEDFPDLGNSFSAQLPLFEKCVLQILATSISLNVNVSPLKSVKLPGSFWIPLSALQYGSCLQMKAWNEVGLISLVSLLSGIQACAAVVRYLKIVLSSFLVVSRRNIIPDSVTSSGLESEVLNYKHAGPDDLIMIFIKRVRKQ